MVNADVERADGGGGLLYGSSPVLDRSTGEAGGEGAGAVGQARLRPPGLAAEFEPALLGKVESDHPGTPFVK